LIEKFIFLKQDIQQCPL